MLLEPVMAIEVVAPEASLGDVLGDLSSRRGAVQRTELERAAARVEARAPLVELFGYTSDLRGMTRGRGAASMRFMGYAPAPVA